MIGRCSVVRADEVEVASESVEYDMNGVVVLSSVRRHDASSSSAEPISLLLFLMDCSDQSHQSITESISDQ